jgi:hypothetical protein
VNCQGYDCTEQATQSRGNFHCCDFHARNYDYVTARNEAMKPFAAEARAEQAAESRVS